MEWVCSFGWGLALADRAPLGTTGCGQGCCACCCGAAMPSFCPLQVPLRMMESVECRDMFQLHIVCKDSKVIRYPLL